MEMQVPASILVRDGCNASRFVEAGTSMDLVNFVQTDRFRMDGWLGFRYLNLAESLRIEDQLFPLMDNTLTFLGQPIDAASSLKDIDSFRTNNNFYGGHAARG